MNGLGRDGADPEHCGEQIRPGTQVLHRTEVLQTVAFGLDRILWGGNALHRDLGCLQLKGLLRAGRQHQGACDDQGGADVLAGDLVVIIQRVPLEYDLQRLEAAAVVELDEAEALLVAEISCPAADGDALPVKGGGFGVDAGDFLSLHCLAPVLSLCAVCARIFYLSKAPSPPGRRF